MRNLVLLLSLAMLWGPSFIFIKVAVADIPPVTLSALRVVIAGIILSTLLWFQPIKTPGSARLWRVLTVMAIITHVFPFVIVSWGQQFIDSAEMAIVNGTVPIFTIFLAHFFDERMTGRKLLGILIGFVGIVFLAVPKLEGGFNPGLQGMLAAVIGSACYASGIIYSRRNLRGQPPFLVPSYQLMIASVFLVPLSLYFDTPWALPIPPVKSMAAVVALSVLGTSIAFILYYKLLETAGATYISMVTYLMPVVGVVLGVLVLNEKLNAYVYGGFVLVVGGVIISSARIEMFRNFWAGLQNGRNRLKAD